MCRQEKKYRFLWLSPKPSRLQHFGGSAETGWFGSVGARGQIDRHDMVLAKRQTVVRMAADL